MRCHFGRLWHRARIVFDRRMANDPAMMRIDAMAIGDLAKQIQESSDSRLRERLREVDPMSPAWSGIIAELEWRASQKMHRQTRALVWLTWTIAILTFVLLLYTIVVALIYPMRGP